MKLRYAEGNRICGRQSFAKLIVINKIYSLNISCGFLFM